MVRYWPIATAFGFLLVSRSPFSPENPPFRLSPFRLFYLVCHFLANRTILRSRLERCSWNAFEIASPWNSANCLYTFVPLYLSCSRVASRSSRFLEIQSHYTGGIVEVFVSIGTSIFVEGLVWRIVAKRSQNLPSRQRFPNGTRATENSLRYNCEIYKVNDNRWNISGNVSDGIPARTRVIPGRRVHVSAILDCAQYSNYLRGLVINPERTATSS